MVCQCLQGAVFRPHCQTSASEEAAFCESLYLEEEEKMVQNRKVCLWIQFKQVAVTAPHRQRRPLTPHQIVTRKGTRCPCPASPWHGLSVCIPLVLGSRGAFGGVRVNLGLVGSSSELGDRWHGPDRRCGSGRLVLTSPRHSCLAPGHPSGPRGRLRGAPHVKRHQNCPPVYSEGADPPHQGIRAVPPPWPFACSCGDRWFRGCF